MEEPGKLREEGNQFFKEGKVDEALGCYTKALELGSIKDSEKAVILKNRAACFLKQENFEAVVKDASQSLELVPEDPKALWRRCQALEKLGRLEEAFRDAALLLRVEPGNRSMQAVYNKLNPLVQQRIKEQNSTSTKLQQMFNLAFDKNVEMEKRKPAVNNLIVLTREEVASAMMCKDGSLRRLAELLAEKDLDLVLGAVRIFTNIAKDNTQRSVEVLTVMSLQGLLQLVNSENETLSTTTALLMQNLFNNITGVQDFQEAVKKYHEVRKKGEPSLFPKLELDKTATEFADNLFPALIKMIGSAKTHGHARDSAMELLTRNVTFKDGINWISKFMETKGIESLLTVAGTVAQHKTLPITESSRMHASVALSRIYDDLNGDKLRERFRERCITFIKDLFGDDIYESKIEAVEALSTLLQGPFDVGNAIMETEGVPQLMFTMAQSENPLHQRVAVEAIVNSAAKKSRCSGLLKDAVPILKNLYKSSDDHIKARALVGLCKLGSFGGTDASIRPMAEGSNVALAKSCRKLLIRPDNDVDVRKWATEGLAYLTLDGDIKEELNNDPAALKSIFDLANKADRNSTYASLTVLVNLTNSYDVQEIMPELKDLAQYSKVHIPEDHPKDKDVFVVGRIRRLVELGVINALVSLSGAESENSRELLSRVFLAIATVTDPDLRGHLVQQGAVKVLISLHQDNTDKGKTLAAQSLAKIAVTMNPSVAFPGQRIYELVRPLLHLLHMDMSALQNFEALLALTNLSSISDSVRNRIFTENGLSKIEHYMYEDHEKLRCAATECVCNLVMHDKIGEMYEGENDRVKLLVLYCGEPDHKLASAASGALAILSARPKVCQKIDKVSAWKEILLYLTANEDPGLQHRGCHTVLSMMMADKELAASVVESQIFEVLMAVSMYTEPQRQAAQKCAQEALDVARNLGLIQPFAEGQQDAQMAQLHRIQELMREKERERLAALKEEEEEMQKEEEELQKKKEEATRKLDVLEEERDREFMYEFPEECKAYENEAPKIKEVTEEEAAQITAGKESKPTDSKSDAAREAPEAKTAETDAAANAASTAKKEKKKEEEAEDGAKEEWDGYSTPPDAEED